MLLADLRSAWRALRRAPGFFAAAVCTLALGIGATTALYGVVHAVLLRPLPYREPGRLVGVWSGHGVANALYDRLRTQTRSYRALAGYSGASDVSVLVRRGGQAPEPARVAASTVTGNLFATLGVGAAVGRPLSPADAVLGAEPAVVVSDAFWRERLGGDARAVGQSIDVGGTPTRVVGVMPPGFRFPAAGVALWTPARVDPSNFGEYWWVWRLQLVGRLMPAVTPEQAEAETRPLVIRTGREYPTPMNADFGTDLRVQPLQEVVAGGARATLVLLFGGVLVVLVVAVVNTTGLALVRAAGRAREFTIRAAVGASRGRVARQLFAEGLVLAGAAGALGTGLAWVITRGLLAVLPRTGGGSVPRVEEVGLDPAVLAFALSVAAVAGLLASLAPALAGARVDLRDALATGARGTTGGVGGRRVLDVLVVAQLALGVVLAVGAGLLATSLTRLLAVDPGFRAEQVTVAAVPLPTAAHDGATPARAFYEAVLTRARALPGVHAAGLASAVPFDGGGSSNGVVDVQAHPRVEGGPWKTVMSTTVTPGTLRAMGVPLLAGRDLSADDRPNGPPAALVDEAAVRAYWPEFGDVARVVGQRVRRPGKDAPWITVVGVVGSVKRDSLSGAPSPSLYTPLTQDGPTAMSVVLRGQVSAGQLAPALRAAVREVDPAVPLGTVRPLTEIVAESAARARFVANVLVAFALAAVVLGAVGVYSVVAYAVARRTRELGVRAAVGATTQHLRRLVLTDGGRLALWGLGFGAGVAFAAERLVRSFLYGVSSAEPVVWLAVLVLLGCVTLVATLAPAVRAGRVSPLLAMRNE